MRLANHSKGKVMNQEEEFDYIKLLEDIKYNEKAFEKINNQKEDKNFEMLQKIERERKMRKEAKKLKPAMQNDSVRKRYRENYKQRWMFDSISSLQICCPQVCMNPWREKRNVT